MRRVVNDNGTVLLLVYIGHLERTQKILAT